MRSHPPPILAAIDRLAAATGLHEVGRHWLSGGVTILMYHRVLPDRLASEYPLANLVVRESNFAKQVRWLSRHTRTLTVSGALRWQRESLASDRPVVALTFDDGYHDNFEIAAPHLDRHGVPATFFVTTGFIDGATMWFDEAASAFQRLGPTACSNIVRSSVDFGDLNSFIGHMKSLSETGRRDAVAMLRSASGPLLAGLLYSPMSPAEVRMLERSGHEVGSHTQSHPVLPGLATQQLVHELQESRRRIEEWTGTAPEGFCYPNGNVNGEVRAAVAASGYSYACTTQRGVNRSGRDPFMLHRWLVAPASTSYSGGRHSDSMFAGEVLGLHGLMRSTIRAVRGLRWGCLSRRRGSLHVPPSTASIP